MSDQSAIYGDGFDAHVFRRHFKENFMQTVKCKGDFKCENIMT